MGKPRWVGIAVSVLASLPRLRRYRRNARTGTQEKGAPMEAPSRPRGAGDYFRAISNLLTSTPRLKPRPVPVTARDTSPLVIARLSALFTAPALAPAVA